MLFRSHWGHDIGPEDNPLQAGLGFAVDWDKAAGFRGREALGQIAKQVPTRRMTQFLLDDPESMLYHEEPIWRDGERVGRTTSGMYGHTLGGSVGLGYVESAAGVDQAFIAEGRWEIEVAGERIPARASLAPMYDPRSERVRG